VDAGAQTSTSLALSVLAQAVYLDNYIGGGSYYPKGGGQILAAGFVEVIRSHGGTIRTNAGVEKVLIEGGSVVGVRLEGGELASAPVVVSDADLIRTFTDLVGLEHLPKKTQLRVKSLRMGHPLINGYFGIERDLSATPNSNYFAIPTWQDTTSLVALERFVRQVVHGKGLDGVTWARQFAARMPMFLQSSTLRDPSNRHNAPVGNSTVEVQTITPYDPRIWGFDGYDVASGDYRRDKAYREIKTIVTDGMLARLEQVYPGASAKVTWSELATPATQERFVGNTGGAPFGLEGTPAQSGPLRPGTRTSLKGLFLVGTSTAWGPGTEGSMISGVHAASAIVGRDLAAEIHAGAVIADPARLVAWGPDFDPLDACRGFGKGTPQSNDDELADPLTVG
jgi:phytoene dehydrogenase-like protein